MKNFLLMLGLFLCVEGMAQSYIRINQLGYLEQDFKVAVFVSTESPKVESFELVNAANEQVVFSSDNIRSYGPWAAFKVGYRLNFSSFTIPGNYYIKAANIKSPVFPIGNQVYDGTADFLLNYMRQQRSKFNPFLKDSCHTSDGFIVYHPDKTKDSTYLDVAGGWHDASDYLQYLPTSATAVFQMLFAYKQNKSAYGDAYNEWGLSGSNGIPDIIDEAKWGMDWLVKMNPSPTEYYNQLADDRDHAGMRLPTLDTIKYASNKGLARPVYFITGNSQGEKYKNKTKGVASSAGKFASSFAMGYLMLYKYYPVYALQLKQKAIDAYAFGKSKPGNTQTISMKSPYIYAEDNWIDDMTLAANMLYLATKDAKYKEDALQYARMEPVTPWMGADTANHYQYYPFVNLGMPIGAGFKKHSAEYLSNMRQGIQRVRDRGKNNPFLMGVPFIWCSNNLVSGILTQTALYRNISKDRQFDEQEAAWRDWLLGCNPWGTSMIIDLPEHGVSPKDPHSAFTHLYQYKISGGLIDGPVYGTIWNRLIGIKLYEPDEFAHLQSPLVVYHDDYGDYSTNEPTMDGTAGLTYIFGELQNRPLKKDSIYKDAYGAITRIKRPYKNVYLVFSAHDRSDGFKHILKTLHYNNVKAAFFLTGDFYRKKRHKKWIDQLKKDGHYIGVHSDKHLLYAPWNKRDSLLISIDEFNRDMDDVHAAQAAHGIRKATYFLPPYEWYNQTITDASTAKGLTLINFTPGTGTNADYTTPDMPNYKTSETLYNNLLEFEKREGLDGAFILIHPGTEPARKDKFYYKLDKLIKELKQRGYTLEIPAE